MTASLKTLAAARRAIPVRERSGWMSIALIPGLVTTTWTTHAWGWSIVAATIACVVLPRLLRGSQTDHDWTLPSSILVASMWLMATPPQARICALPLLLVLYLAFRERDVANPFQPVLIACAVALALFPQPSPSFARDAQPAWIAVACMFGGIVLIACRCVRPQAPLGMLAGFAGAAAIANAMRPAWFADTVWLSLTPSIALTVFFLVDDPLRTCMNPRARALWGFFAGAIAATVMLALQASHRDARMLLALAGSVLLMNAAAPWLDRRFDHRRSTRGTGVPVP
jgi:Na+-translocating ferredoxin:NAD+ oxidoreductase RnfD subunit